MKMTSMAQKVVRSWTSAASNHPIKLMSITNAILGVIGDGISQKIEIGQKNGMISFKLSENKFNFERSMRFAAWGLLMGPVVFKWYTILNKKFPTDKMAYINKDKPKLLNKSRIKKEENTSSVSLGSVLGVKRSPVSEFRMKEKVFAEGNESEYIMNENEWQQSKIEKFKAVSKRVAVDQIVFAPIGLLLFFAFMQLTETESEQKEGFRIDISKYMSALLANYMIWPLFQMLNFSIIPLHLRVPASSFFGILWNSYLSFINSR
ncbi:Protein SYM1 [Smittium culicis]|uniref:Protein SYM1 n=1 Tax=Smittium culicis TaxID=133412 RepID=A0A1R1Y1C4_9FUNG|nr:Protein SYM1 [Smittium culicis]OMJ20742.1 Protein SYM1 [Smittium culicis]